MIALVAVSLMPTTEKSYLSAVGTAVEDSRGAVLTVAEVSDTVVRGDIPRLAAHVTIEDSLKDAQSALEELIAEEVPTAHAREMRDAAVPLLTRATSLINDIATANDEGDDQALTTTSATLRELATALAGVQERTT